MSGDYPMQPGLGFEGMNHPPPPPPGHNSVYPSLSIGFEDVNPPAPPPSQPNLPGPPTYGVNNPAFEVDNSTSVQIVQAMDANESTSLVKDRNSGDQGDNTTVDMKDDSDDIPDRYTLLFRDGERKIDYVLAYTDLQDSTKSEKREAFLRALREEGLQLETEDKKYSQDGATYFCKVFMPWKMCLNHAELLKIKMPIQANDIDEPLSVQCCQPCGPFKANVEEEEDFFTAPFYKDGDFIGYEGPNKENPDFFSPAQRGRMVFEVLQRARYGDQKEQFGIKRLLRQGIFTAAYPLHAGSYKSANAGVDKIENKRQELYYEWARPKAFMKEQPYDAIRTYFGEKVAIYFSWLGFYTLMLVPAAVVGIIVFLYGIIATWTDDVVVSICNATDIILCPLCDKRCSYTKLSDSCTYSRATYVVDNPGTIFFAIFMALWTAFFIEFWKRQQARIQYDWDVSDYEQAEQNIRPEYEASVSSKKKNPITQDYEPHMRSMERCIRVGSSFVFILFMICVVLAAILAIILYRIFIVVLIYQGDSALLKSQARLVTSITAAVLSVIAITLLNKVYEKIAIGLTNMETWKYQSEWEDAFTFKMYIFQFVNYYGTIIYIAFFKGQFTGRPGAYDRALGARGEECDPAGCLIELAIQLAIVMVGKQALNNCKEIIIPLVVRCIKSRKGKQKIETDDDKYTSWERDYDLVDFPVNGLYEEYLEMVIQYGFVTLFVAAFPLAPFFALLNNIIEVRLDAMKLVTQWKRPLADRAQDIGTWFYILKAVSKLAILVNACIIAFTSDFIKKAVFRYTEPDAPMSHYVEWSLSQFRTSDFREGSIPPNDTEINGFGDLNRTNHICWYRDFRLPPDDPNKYTLTATYWHVLVARLAFVIVFEHVVLAVAGLINFLIPDIPVDVRDRSLREKHLSKVALHQRIKNENTKRQNYTGSSSSIQHATSL